LTWVYFLAKILSALFRYMETNMEKKIIDRKNFDLSADPRDDFYQYVNGGWLKSNPIPPSKSRWGTFDVLDRQSARRLRAIVEKIVSKEHPKGSERQKVKDFYLTGMDSKKLNRQGIVSLQGELDRISSVKTLEDLMAVVAHLHRIGINSLWNIYVDQDAKDNELMALKLCQGGLGLPDQDYYVSKEGKAKELLEQYLDYIARSFALLGNKNPNRSAKIVLKIEASLARVSMTRVERRDPVSRYNKMTFSQLRKLAPNVPWQKYFDEVKIPKLRTLVVEQLKFFEGTSSLLGQISIEEWRVYLSWCLLNQSFSRLGDKFVRHSFSFYGKKLSGAKKMKPRWERCIGVLDKFIGHAISKDYVAFYFPPKAKKIVNELVDHLIAAYGERIKNLDWMTGKTKAKALEKLDRVARKLGYPDVWEDYGDMDIRPDAYILNCLRANEFWFRRMLKKLGKPVDRSEWFLNPPTINAGYLPQMNEILFPAGIMQSPFFDPDADDAVNYAGIGAVIGHELTHGFDDKGSKYDAKGNLKDWWTKRDRDNFEKRTKKLVRQFENRVVIDGKKVNGKLTLGENIADLGGLSIAFDALQKALKEKGRPGLIDGFTPEQRFFINWAQIWRININDELARQHLVIDPHAPCKLRVLEPLANMEAFHKAFGCRPKDRMYRPKSKRAKVW